MTTTPQAEPVPAETRSECSHCHMALDECSFCEGTGCPAAICYRCLDIELGAMQEPHEHGG